jgi:cyclic pyranopterin phosphate synthase
MRYSLAMSSADMSGVRRCETAPSPAPDRIPPLADGFGRRHDNLRISVTDRCNIRCFYCMPEETPDYVPKAEILTYEEILRFVHVAAGLGIKKIRLTGGEPLVRRDLAVLVGKLTRVPGIQDVALTTNGLLLAEQAQALFDAGLRRINVHLDTLDPGRFRWISKRDGLDRVLDGIETVRRIGYHPVKLNAVAVKGVTEEDLVPLARFGRERGIQVRFIEFMPLDSGRTWRRDQVLLAEDILAILAREIAPLSPSPDQDPRAPAADYDFADGVGSVGIIASVSRPFCGACNRIRLTADGKLRNCLFARDEMDARALLRGGAGDAEIAALIRRSVGAKWEGHDINSARFIQPARPMYAIGG